VIIAMRFARTSPSLWLTASVIAGIAYMAMNGAPLHYPAINAIALGLALVLMRIAPGADSSRAPIGLAAIAIFVLALPILAGPEVKGVNRWIELGPVRLHSGMLVLPMLAVILPRLKPMHQVATLALAAIAVSLQPDRASAIALMAGAGASLGAHRSSAAAALFLTAGFSVWASFAQPDVLTAVPFVENVLPDAWRAAPLGTVALAAALFAAIFFPAFGNGRLFPMAAVLAGFTIASLIGAYPVPLIGYGASAILGFGLAVAAARQPVQ
jgi:hypothetical protein